MSRRYSHLVPVQYCKEKNVEETIERGERRTTFPNPAVSSHQLLLNATTDSTKQCNLSHLSNVYRPIPHRRYFQAPYSGPPSYATLAKRFSTDPTPVPYYRAKKVSEAIKRGQYVDIHDIGGPDPNDYDYTDMDYDTLKTEISELGGIPYLQKATKNDAEEIVEEGTALIFGTKNRVIFPAVVKNAENNKAHWIYFFIDTGAPITYLSTQAAELLDISKSPAVVTIGGFLHPVYQSPPDSHFSDINLLGSDFMLGNQIAWTPDSDRGIVKLRFRGLSKGVKPAKL